MAKKESMMGVDSITASVIESQTSVNFLRLNVRKESGNEE